MARVTGPSRPVVWPLLGSLVLAGMTATRHLPMIQRTMEPRPTLTVRLYWPGASALSVERELTAPVERVLHGVRGIRSVRSTSEEAVATVTATIDPAVDLAWIRLGVREQLERLRPTFPGGISNPDLSQEPRGAPTVVPLALLTLNGPRTSSALQRLLETVVAPRLRALPGVARVTLVGGTSAGLAITIDPYRAGVLGRSSLQVAQQIGAVAEVTTVGLDRRAITERTIRIDDRPESGEALAQLPIIGRGGEYRPLGDLADIRPAEQSHERFHRVNGQPVVGLEVEGHPGMDPRSTMALIRQELAAVRTDLPAGLHLRVVRDGTEELSRQLRAVVHRLSVAALGVLALCLLRWGHTGTVARLLVITASALGATTLTLALWGRAVPVATPVIMSLAIGPLVMLTTGTSTASAFPSMRRNGSWQQRMSTQLPWVAIACPIAFLPAAVQSRVAPPLFALLALVGWHAVGATGLSVVALTRGMEPPRARFRARWSLAPAWAIILTVCWTGGWFWYGMTASASTAMSAEASAGSTLRVDVTAPRGTDPALLDAVVRPFERMALADPVAITTRVSGAGAEAQVLVEIDPLAQDPAAPRRLQERFVSQATQVGGMALLVQGSGPAYHVGDDSRGHTAFRLQLAGYQWEPLDSLATALVARLERIPRVREVRLSSNSWRETPPGREILVQPDRGAMARLGLPVHAVATTVAGETGGLIGQLTLPIAGDDQDVSVREAGTGRGTLALLGERPLPIAHALRVRLRDVAGFHERIVPTAIEREAQRYVRYLHYEIRGTARQAQRIQSGLRRTLAPPPGFTITDLTTSAEAEAEGPAGPSWRMALLAMVLAGLAAAMRSSGLPEMVSVWLVLPAVMAGALVAQARLGPSLPPESLTGLVLAGGVMTQLATARGVRMNDAWWVLSGTVASTAPFLVVGGAETPGRLTAAVVLTGIGLGTVSLALTGALFRDRID